MSSTLVVPHFDDEADEAQWWFDNQDKLAAAYEAAAADGTLRQGSLKERLELARKRAQSVTLSDEDVALARELATTRGQTYENYVRSIMHRALQLEKSA